MAKRLLLALEEEAVLPACVRKGAEAGQARSSGVAACQEELVYHNSPEQTFGLLTCITPQFSYDLILLPGILFFSLLQ